MSPRKLRKRIVSSMPVSSPVKTLSKVPTPTQRRVHDVLGTIPRGEVLTFAELAELADLGTGRGPGIAGSVVRKVALSALAGDTVQHSRRLPWWRVVCAGQGAPLQNLLPGPPARRSAQHRKLSRELGSRLQAPLVRKLSLPSFIRAHFSDVRIWPAEGKSSHERTLIYLHGFGGRGRRYLADGLSLPWVLPREQQPSVPGLRVVLPTAPRITQPWGELKPSWYAYKDKRSNAADVEMRSVQASRQRLVKVLHEEIARLGGDARNVFLGGLSQGCGVALDIYVREGVRLGLGGFVGVAGWFPSDADGFPGADAALARLAGHAQGSRPLWLMLPTDDARYIPWPFASASLLRARKVCGLKVRKVHGRGHGVGDWEGHFVGEFLETVCRK